MTISLVHDARARIHHTPPTLIAENKRSRQRDRWKFASRRAVTAGELSINTQSWARVDPSLLIILWRADTLGLSPTE